MILLQFTCWLTINITLCVRTVKVIMTQTHNTHTRQCSRGMRDDLSSQTFTLFHYYSYNFFFIKKQRKKRSFLHSGQSFKIQRKSGVLRYRWSGLQLCVDEFTSIRNHQFGDVRDFHPFSHAKQERSQVTDELQEFQLPASFWLGPQIILVKNN